MLPRLPYNSGKQKSMLLQFGGYDHRRGAGNGTIWNEQNMSADEAPLMTPRKPRLQTAWDQQDPNGIYGSDELYIAAGTGLYVDGTQKGTLENSEKVFAQLGAYTCIWPDKKCWNRVANEMQDLTASWTGTAAFSDGTLYGESAEKNTIRIVSGLFPFKAGDAVRIESTLTGNSKTIIVREVQDSGLALAFYENSFETNGADTGLKLYRDVPDLDWICVNENRVWGCKGDTIYASKLGDPFNWNVFDGLSTDSYAVDVGTEGDFTGCCSFLGYPCFFKENHIYKVYGDKPSNFHVMQSADLGVAPGSGRSLAIAGEVLFYLSRAGVMAYTGGIPQHIGDVFGDVRYRDAVGGSDGLRYYISMTDGNSNRHLFVYDTRYGIWHREDDFDAVGIAWCNGCLWALSSAGKAWILAGDTPPEWAHAAPETGVSSMAEFGDFDEGSPQRKGASHVEIRAELEEGAGMTVKAQYDSSGTWVTVGAIAAGQKRSVYLPVITKRCDHWRLKIEGTGMWRIYSITRSLYIGSEFH